MTVLTKPDATGKERQASQSAATELATPPTVAADAAVHPSEQTRKTKPDPTADHTPRRLVVEINRRTAADLAWLTETEELNKTTVVNRALQVYKMLVEVQQRGGAVVLEDPAKGTQERMLFM